jgi:hypothetical protein
VNISIPLFKRLTSSVQKLFADRQLDSVDMVVHLRRLPAKEQTAVANEAANGRLSSADIRAICEYYEKHPGGIDHAIDRVKATRNVKQYVVEFVIRGSNRSLAHVQSKFANALTSDNIVSLTAGGSIGKLIISQQGRLALQRIARRHKCSQAEAVQLILSGQA